MSASESVDITVSALIDAGLHTESAAATDKSCSIADDNGDLSDDNGDISDDNEDLGLTGIFVKRIGIDTTGIIHTQNFHRFAFSILIFILSINQYVSLKNTSSRAD